MTDISMTWPQYRRRQCSYYGRIVCLTPCECEVLSTLLVHRGQVVSRNEIIEAVYLDPDAEPSEAWKLIDRFISHLKAKLPGMIEVVWGRGIIISVEAERLAA